MPEVLSEKLLISIFNKYGGDMINCARAIERNVIAKLSKQKAYCYVVGNIYADNLSTAKELSAVTGYKIKTLIVKPSMLDIKKKPIKKVILK